MKITYRADAHVARVSIRGVTFAQGETEEVPDQIGELLLRNANFVDERGRNENFECGGCGKETREIAILRKEPVSLRHEDGKLRCVACHDARIAVAPTPIATDVAAPVTALDADDETDQT